jgi:hypothetical protein
MKLFAGLCSSLLLVFSSVGCCCMSSCVSSCDPCGRELCGGGWKGSSCGSSCGGCGLGGCLSKWFHHRCHKCHPMYAGYGWDAYSGCGDVCYDGCNTTYGMASGGGCACGQPHGPMAVPMTPPAQQAPVPAAIDPMSARPAQRTMATQVAHQPMQQPLQHAAPQQVSYEEFQRLPGTMVPAPSAPPMVPPVQR